MNACSKVNHAISAQPVRPCAIETGKVGRVMHPLMNAAQTFALPPYQCGDGMSGVDRKPADCAPDEAVRTRYQ
jgi:hypothetical protein